MNLKSLKNAVGLVLRSKRLGKKPKLPRKRTTAVATNCGAQPEFPMPPACDIKVFALLDLPTELVEAIISEMMTVVGFDRAVRLRFVNSEPSTHSDKPALTN